MAKLLDPRERLRFEIPGQDDVPEEARAVYLFRAPTIIDKARFRRAVVAQGVRPIGQAQLRARARAVVTEVFDAADPDRDRLLGLLDQAETDPEPIAGELEQLGAMLLQTDPDYARMVSDQQFYLDVAPIEAARMFLTGWENVEVEFRRDARGVTDAALAALPEAHLLFAGAHALSLFAPTEAEAKNSASPSPGAQEEAISTAENMQPQSAPSADTCRTESAGETAGISTS